MSGATKHLWRRATLLAVASLLFAALLGGLSAWFLASVALVGATAGAATFNIHVPGALVRLFAIGRTVTKYGERLTGHQAALHDQVTHRSALFRTLALSPDTLRTGWQMARGDRLADYLDDVEDVDFGRLRTWLPMLSGAVGVGLGVLSAAWVAPLSLLFIAIVFCVIALCAKAFHAQAIRLIQTARSGQRQGEAQLGAALASVAPLKAGRQFALVVDDALKALDQSEATAARLQLRQTALESLASAAGPLIALAVILAAWANGARGEALTPAIFVGFAWLALGDAIAGVARIITARVKQQIAASNLAAPKHPTNNAPAKPTPTPISTILLSDWPRIAPDGRVIGAPVGLVLAAGQPTVLTGVSGSGKTSLLKQIAGWIGDNTAYCGSEPLDPGQRQAISLFCLHDAAILADTVRANLFASDRPDDELWTALDLVDLRPRIELAGGLDGWIEQAALSLGEAQRLNLTRVLLSDKQLILLDEPSEHLDADQGRKIIHRLLRQLEDRIVVVSTHRDLAAEFGPSVQSVQLQAASST